MSEQLPTGVRDLYAEPLKLTNYRCIVCNNPIFCQTITIDYRGMKVPANNYVFIRLEKNTFVSACSKRCEELYNMTPLEYEPYFRDDIR